jgi:hypothetical protein
LDFTKVVDSMAGFFEREKVPFALAGAFALHAYGLSRATSDVDFVTESGVRDRLLPVPRAEHLAAMKVHAMKNVPAARSRRWPTSRSFSRFPGSTERRSGATS